VGAENPIQGARLRFLSVVVAASMWEIESNSVGNGSDQGRRQPRPMGFCRQPTDRPTDRTLSYFDLKKPM
jgi:hypothetical protein